LSCIMLKRQLPSTPTSTPTNPKPPSTPTPTNPDPTRPKTLKGAIQEFGHDSMRVFRHPVWVLMVAAYTMYCSVIGAYAFWGPKAGREMYGLKGTTADLYFGGVTVITGVCGGLGGGILLDWMGTTLRNANLVCAVASLGGLAAVLVAFLAAKTFPVFLGLFAIGELLLFMLQVRARGMAGWVGGWVGGLAGWLVGQSW